MKNTERTCGICGALMALMVIDGVWVERCERSGATACPEPRVEWLHNHTPEPRAPMARPVYVLGTATYTLDAKPGSYLVSGQPSGLHKGG
jgi:hypothetical protein